MNMLVTHISPICKIQAPPSVLSEPAPLSFWGRQSWNKPTHTPYTKCTYSYFHTHTTLAWHTSVCSFSGDLSVSQAQHWVHRCWYISTMHVPKAPLLSCFVCVLFYFIFFFLTFALISDFPKHWYKQHNTMERQKKRISKSWGERNENSALLVRDVYLFIM